MKRLLALFCIVLCGFSASAAREGVTQTRDQATVQTGTGVISGMVSTDEPQSKPLRLVRVSLAIPGSGMASFLAVTSDDEGRFTFTGVPAGRYTLTPTRPSFIGLNYGAARPQRPGTVLVLSDGQKITDLVVKMLRGAAITGRLTDQTGAPLVGMVVRLLRYTVGQNTGDRVLVYADSERCRDADDRGIYRCFGLAPDEYVVLTAPAGRPGRAAQGGPMSGAIRQIMPGDVSRALQTARGAAVGGATPTAAPSAWQTGPSIGYATTFYPGTLDVRAATPVAVTAGEERAGVDFQMRFVSTARIDGQVSVPDGVAPGLVQVRRNDAGPSLPGASESLATVDAAGRFSFAGVSAGDYVISARASSAMDPALWDAAGVRVDGRDQSIALTLRASLTVSGRLKFEGPSPPPALTTLRIGLVSRGGRVRGGPGASVNADGSFAIAGVTPDRYQFNLTGGTLDPWVLKSAIIKGIETLDASVTIDASDQITDWIITLTDRPATLTGMLQSEAGRPAPEYFIVVFPTDRSAWAPASIRRLVVLRPSTDGRFSTRTLPPGSYNIAALTDVAPGEHMNPAFLDQLVASAVRVVLVEGRTTTQDLKIGR